MCGGWWIFKKKQFKLEKWDEDEDHGGLRHNLLPFFFCTFKFWLFFLRHNAFRDQVPWNRSLIPGQLAVASILDKVGPNRNSMVLKNLQNLRLKSWGKGVPRRNKTLLMMDDKLLLRPAVSSKKRGIEGSGEVLVYQPDQRCHACSILEAGVCWWGL